MPSPTEVNPRFAGKAALITGAGSGVGRATAVRLAREGAEVLGFDIDAEGLKGTVDLVTEAGGKIHIRQGDVSKPAECKATVEEAVATMGKLDVLGNVAGIARADHVVDVTEESYRRMFGVNADGYFFMAQAAIPHLLETSGNIVNIASCAGLIGQAYTVVYCMTKGAVVQLTRALAMEFVKTPLRVNAIAPGGINTNLVGNYQMPADVDFDLIMPYAGFRPMAEPDEIANLFAFIASYEGANLNGAIMSTDNGITAG
jgi:NAD(P)-dependent dehydrogenase (short-subunit alcohol dehydrogenase family)